MGYFRAKLMKKKFDANKKKKKKEKKKKETKAKMNSACLGYMFCMHIIKKSEPRVREYAKKVKRKKKKKKIHRS